MVTLYLITALPVVTPPTTPAEVTVAIEGAAVIHVPPAAPELVSDIALPVHTLSVPLIVPAFGKELIMILAVVVVLPHAGVEAV